MNLFSRLLVQALAVTFCLANIEDTLLELEAVVQLQSAENEKLRARVTELEADVADMVADTAVDLESAEGRKQSEASELSSGHRFKRSDGITPSFHAFLSKNKCHTDRETIIFDAEALDRGGYGSVGIYDKRDGIFEPPTSGAYAFTWTIAAPLHVRFTTELIISGNVAGVMTTDSDLTLDDGGTGIHPATAFVVADVNAGSHCYIRTRYTNGDCSMILSDSNEVRTTFSAWELFAV